MTAVRPTNPVNPGGNPKRALLRWDRFDQPKRTPNWLYIHGWPWDIAQPRSWNVTPMPQRRGPSTFTSYQDQRVASLNEGTPHSRGLPSNWSRQPHPNHPTSRFDSQTTGGPRGSIIKKDYKKEFISTAQNVSGINNLYIPRGP